MDLAVPNGQDCAIDTAKRAAENSSSCGGLAESELSTESQLSKVDTGFPSCFDGLVTRGKYISDGSNLAPKRRYLLMHAPSLVTPLLLKEPDKFPSEERDVDIKDKDFFSSTAGKFLIALGLTRVSEWYHKHRIQMKRRQKQKEGKSQLFQEELAVYQRCYAEAKKANEPFTHSSKSCDMCNFVTE